MKKWAVAVRQYIQNIGTVVVEADTEFEAKLLAQGLGGKGTAIWEHDDLEYESERAEEIK